HLSLFVPILRPPHPSPLFPYTTLFRSYLIADRVGSPDQSDVAQLERSAVDPQLPRQAYRLEGGELVGASFRGGVLRGQLIGGVGDRKSTRLNSSHLGISYAVFCLKKKK